MTSFGFLSRHRNWLFPLFLIAATFMVYHPAWHGGYLWDEVCIPHDPKDLSNYTWRGMLNIWFHQTHQYYPLTYTSCWLEYHLWGLNTTGYHLVNILLHCLSSIVLWLVLRRLSVPGAWLAAAIFALHPVNVESVAWLAERKNTLSCFFYLCAMLAALKFWLPEETSAKKSDIDSPNPVGTRWRASEADRQAGPTIAQGEVRVTSVAPERFKDCKFYWLAFALFVCALLSKTSTIPMPAVILLLVWWKRGKITWPDVRPIFPFLAAGVAVGLITHLIERHLGAHGKAFQISFVDRTLLAARNFWFYLGKLIWPHPLIFNYPRWKISPSPAIAWLSLLAFVPVLAVLWLKRNTWGRPVFVALAYFGGMLFLMLGFFNIYFFVYSFVADHFQYLACMGPITLLAAGAALAVNRLGQAKVIVAPILSVGLLTVLGVLTWKQCSTYTDAETLWRTTAAQNPNSFLAHLDMGDILMDKGDMEAAIQEYRKSLTIRDDADACHNLGNALLQTGQPNEAAVYFKKALELQPENPIGYSDIGNLFLQTGHTDAAIQYFQKALQIDPIIPIACYNLGNAYAQKGQLDLAIQSWQKAVSEEPDYPMPHNNLGNAFLMKGQIAQAIQQWEEALKWDPDLTTAQANLAWVMATCPQPWLRNGPAAVALAERADKLSNGTDPLTLRSLAAAYAETGHFSDAIATAQQALQMARNNPGLSATIESELKVYQKGQPYRDPSLAPQ